LEEIEYQVHPETTEKASISTPIDSEEALVQKEKGNLYFKKSKFGKAIECYSKSIELDCNQDIPLVNRAFAYLKLKK
jgi:tetratricopeptide (TPR) repeat protein